jgi:putative transposase
LLCLAVIYEGGLRSEAAALGGVGLQIIRDWVLRFNADGPEGLIDRKPPGASAKLNDAQRRALCEIVESGPIPAIHGVVRWRLKDLMRLVRGWCSTVGIVSDSLGGEVILRGWDRWRVGRLDKKA